MTTFDIDAVRARFGALRNGFVFLDAPGGTQVPDEVGEAMARTVRDASGNLGAPYATSRAVEEILARAKEDAAGFLGCASRGDRLRREHDDARLRALARGRPGFRRRGRDPRHPARPRRRGRAVDRARGRPRARRPRGRRTDDFTVDVDDLERKLGERTRVVAFAWPRTRSARSPTRGGSARSPARPAPSRGSTPSTTPRTSRSTSRRPAATSSSALRTSSADRTSASAYLRDVGRRALAAVQGAPIVLVSRRPALRDRHARVRAARGVQRDHLVPRRRSAAWGRSPRTSEMLGDRFLAGLPETVTLYGPGTMEGRVPTFLLNVDGRRRRRRGRAARRARLRRLVLRQLVLRRAGRAACPSARSAIGLIHYNTADEVDRAARRARQARALARTSRAPFPAWPVPVGRANAFSARSAARSRTGHRRPRPPPGRRRARARRRRPRPRRHRHLPPVRAPLGRRRAPASSHRSTSGRSGRATRRARSRRSAARARTRTSGRTAASSPSSTACRSSGTASSSAASEQYRYVDTVFFTDQVQTGCGFAELAGRPLLLPARQAWSTSTSASSTSCSRASAPAAGRSRRRT